MNEAKSTKQGAVIYLKLQKLATTIATAKDFTCNSYSYRIMINKTEILEEVETTFDILIF